MRSPTAARACAAALVLTSAACGGAPQAGRRAETRPLPAPQGKADAMPPPTIHPKSAAPSPEPATPAFWGRPVVDDGFDGDRVDPRTWLVYDYPDARVNPRTKAATTVADGVLKLTGGLYRGRDLSGGIASRLHQTHGRWEVRMRAERGVGYAAVALLWPKVFGHPEFAEINFAEIIDPDRRDAGLFVHYGPRGTQLQRDVRGDFTAWHVFALDWLPHRLTFWMDGRRIWSYRGPLTPERSKMGLALQNDQVCDRGAGFCRSRTTPRWVSMYVDRARIYRAPAGQ